MRFTHSFFRSSATDVLKSVSIPFFRSSATDMLKSVSIPFFRSSATDMLKSVSIPFFRSSATDMLKSVSIPFFRSSATDMLKSVSIPFFRSSATDMLKSVSRPFFRYGCVEVCVDSVFPLRMCWSFVSISVFPRSHLFLQAIADENARPDNVLSRVGMAKLRTFLLYMVHFVEEKLEKVRWRRRFYTALLSHVFIGKFNGDFKIFVFYWLVFRIFLEKHPVRRTSCQFCQFCFQTGKHRPVCEGHTASGGLWWSPVSRGIDAAQAGRQNEANFFFEILNENTHALHCFTLLTLFNVCFLVKLWRKNFLTRFWTFHEMFFVFWLWRMFCLSGRRSSCWTCLNC